MEPAKLEGDIPIRLAETASSILQHAARLGHGLPTETLLELAQLVRVMNSFYSNRIEGNNTRPREIERALAGDNNGTPEKRERLREHTAHIRLQAEIDRQFALGELPDPASCAFIRNVHRGFYENAPETSLTVRRNGLVRTISPGEWREDDVEVGEHVPPPSDRIPDFMAYFEHRYGRRDEGGNISKIIAAVTAHHRFNWIHPFLDGNGRVSRLMCHAMLHDAGAGAGGLWSISRGMARGLEQGLPGREEYPRMMAMADRRRQGDRDGRGNLSLSALTSFTQWMLDIANDQIQFMTRMFEFDRLGERLERYASLEALHEKAPALLRACLNRGEIERGDVPSLIGVAPRTARMITRQLLDDGILGSHSGRSPLSLRFPAKTHDILFPRLFDDV